MKTKTMLLNGKEYEIPVWAKWLAQDRDGAWSVYSVVPRHTYVGYWATSSLKDGDYRVCKDRKRPEPGHWTEQLYFLD
jgi:hypothetical protein